MSVFLWMIITCICYVIFKSISGFIRGESIGFERSHFTRSRFSTELFYTLLIIYSIIIIGFGLIYFILSFQGIILMEHGELRRANLLGELIHSLYFSGVTLLTIGYGDIVPIGIGRFIALIQALIGYILPTAFVLRLVQFRQRSHYD